MSLSAGSSASTGTFADSPKGRNVAVIAVLVVFPMLYLLNGLTPWSAGLWVRHDRGWYIPFFASVIVLHWASVVAVAWVLRRNRMKFEDIGLRNTPIRLIGWFAGLMVLGLLFVVLRQYLMHVPTPAQRSDFLPATLPQRLFFVVSVLTAGFCEELVYRAFAISMLMKAGVPTWLALVLPAIAFAFIHGFAAVGLAFFGYFAFGVGFGLLFLWRRSILPGMVFHTIIDMTAILAP